MGLYKTKKLLQRKKSVKWKDNLPNEKKILAKVECLNNSDIVIYRSITQPQKWNKWTTKKTTSKQNDLDESNIHNLEQNQPEMCMRFT